MRKQRIVYLDWIVELGYDPTGDAPDRNLTERESSRTEMIRSEVDRAVRSLSDEEQEFVRRFHFMGQGYQEIAEVTGREIHRLESLNRQVLKKLKKRLAGFVKETFDLEITIDSSCPICKSIHRVKIDQIIAAKPPDATWSGVIAEIKRRFGLRLQSPQRIIGHQKYHK